MLIDDLVLLSSGETPLTKMAMLAVDRKHDMLSWVLNQKDQKVAREAFHRARNLMGIKFADTLVWTL